MRHAWNVLWLLIWIALLSWDLAFYWNDPSWVNRLLTAWAAAGVAYYGWRFVVGVRPIYVAEENRCELCPHDREPHLVIATGKTPADGGIILCQVWDCDCYATWSLEGRPKDSVREPSPEEREKMRKMILTVMSEKEDSHGD